MMNRTWLATLLRALRRFGRWLQINLTYVFLLPPERQDLLDLVAHYWIQAIRLTSGYSVDRRLVRAALPPPQPRRMWQFHLGQFWPGKPAIIGGNCVG